MIHHSLDCCFIFKYEYLFCLLRLWSQAQVTSNNICLDIGLHIYIYFCEYFDSNIGLISDRTKPLVDGIQNLVTPVESGETERRVVAECASNVRKGWSQGRGAGGRGQLRQQVLREQQVLPRTQPLGQLRRPCVPKLWWESSGTRVVGVAALSYRPTTARGP